MTVNFPSHQSGTATKAEARTGLSSVPKPTLTAGEVSQDPALRDFLAPEFDLNGKAVLVTGGSGSFGKAFVRTVLDRYEPSRLIVFSRDELKQYEMAQEFPAEKYPCLRFFIGDVRNRDRLEMAMRDVDFVIHAAAMKQVTTAEYNPLECIHTNVLGAENIVHAALSTDVKKVIALSTDKAANPINLYGASKLAADKIFVAANHMSGGRSTFSVVRYGNVVGSRGSVVPLFQKMIAEGADHLPITDTRMTRFWITLLQGVNFVLSSMALMQGGEIFVPKISSLSMPDLASALAPSLPQKIVGIRPGEKLHESLITEDDGRCTLEMADRYVIEPAFAWWSRESYPADMASPVSEGFVYSSDNNAELAGPQWLSNLLEEPRI